jgi:hypothetical protein
MANETIRQLLKMEAMLAEYEKGITQQAAAKIYDWLDGVNIFAVSGNNELARKGRKEQADELLSWFEDRINDMKAGIL